VVPGDADEKFFPQDDRGERRRYAYRNGILSIEDIRAPGAPKNLKEKNDMTHERPVFADSPKRQNVNRNAALRQSFNEVRSVRRRTADVGRKEARRYQDVHNLGLS
jgi:hypothetical protein